MKRFDDWAKSSARRAAEPTPETQASGISRREMLKKAGIVGAATVWAAPVVQSVMAPATAQVSPPPIPTCTAPDGSCGSPAKNCTSVCPPDQNRACADNSDCDGNCSGTPLVCVKAPVGGHCYTNTGCTQARCNTTTQTCLTGATGATCTANSQCVTNKCTSGTCAQSTGGCYSTADCSGSRVCVGGGAFVAGTCQNV